MKNFVKGTGKPAVEE